MRLAFGLAVFIALLAWAALACSKPETLSEAEIVASTPFASAPPPAPSQSVNPEPLGVPENRPDWMRPAISASAESDCSGVLERPVDTHGRSWLTKGSAALGYRLKTGKFVPVFYFTSVRSAQDCARGDPDSVILKWDGHDWVP